jgi:hypothetical protein
MSALGQKRTFAAQKAMSALPPKADIGCCRFRRANGRHRFDHIVGASWPAFCSATEGSKALDFMEDKLALLYLIFMLIITIAYVEVSPTKHAQPSPIVTRIQAASE